MSVLTIKPKFLYPRSRQYYPIDLMSEKIVRALEKRNWEVPEISVEFCTYGSGEEKFKYVSEIKGKDFKMFFARSQGQLCQRWNDSAAIHEIWIPREQLEVFSDESGPRYYLYVGEDWEKEKEWFFDSVKVNSKLNGEPRRYLMYEGDKPGKVRSLNLIPDNDLGREYDPEGDEPRIISLKDLYQRFADYLEKNVLDYILSFPEKEPVAEVEQELIPYNGPWKLLYSLCDTIDRKRITEGKKDKESLQPENRHAYFGRKGRLVPVDLRISEELPEKADEGFIWTSPNCEGNIDLMPKHVRFNMGDSWFGSYIVTISPKYANDIYVVDFAKFEETRMRLFDEIAPRTTLNTDELKIAYAEYAKTFVPITEYKGGYKEPIVLIERELDFDEIAWISEERFK